MDRDSIPQFGVRLSLISNASPHGRNPKPVRLDHHRRKICAKKIFLPDLAIWREAFIEELVGFPGEYDDRVDAMTMYLDFMDTNPNIPRPRKPEVGLVIHALPLSRRRSNF